MGQPLDADNIDTSRLAARLWGLRDTIGLERLCERLGVRHRRPHHALADAEATASCFIELLRLGRESAGWTTLGSLLADGQPPPRFEPPPGAPAGGSRNRRRRRPGSAEAPRPR
jgi:DNA polymerase III epsilon subunit-like protein